MKKLYTTPSVELLEVQTNAFCVASYPYDTDMIIVTDDSNANDANFGKNYTEGTW